MSTYYAPGTWAYFTYRPPFKQLSQQPAQPSEHLCNPFSVPERSCMGQRKVSEAVKLHSWTLRNLEYSSGEGTRPRWLQSQTGPGRSHQRQHKPSIVGPGGEKGLASASCLRPQGDLHRADPGSTPTPGLTSCVILGEWLNLSVSQFPCL